MKRLLILSAVILLLAGQALAWEPSPETGDEWTGQEVKARLQTEGSVYYTKYVRYIQQSGDGYTYVVFTDDYYVYARSGYDGYILSVGTASLIGYIPIVLRFDGGTLSGVQMGPR